MIDADDAEVSTEFKCRKVLSNNPSWTTERKKRIGKIEDKLKEWQEEWGGQENLTMPDSRQVEEALFKFPPIFWSGLTDFQDVAMRRIAEMLLHKETPEEPGAANAYARRTY
eukprot:4499556-Prymnesium_polylepis.1